MLEKSGELGGHRYGGGGAGYTLLIAASKSANHLTLDRYRLRYTIYSIPSDIAELQTDATMPAVLHPA